mgnify:CR=1 FL=1
MYIAICDFVCYNIGVKLLLSVPTMIINIVITILALIFFTPLLKLVDFIVPNTPSENITNHIAMLHTVLNTCATLFFLPFVNQIAYVVTKLIKDRKKDEDSHYVLPIIISKMHGSVDVYVIPSSVHEVLIVPQHVMPAKLLAKMCTEINSKEVPDQDILSNNIYEYDAETHSLSITEGIEEELDIDDDPDI